MPQDLSGSSRSYFVGSDIGGTFTDVVVLDDSGRIAHAKSSSTPPRFEKGLLAALEEAAGGLGATLGTLLSRTRVFAHGCTVATNALVSRKGARVGVITTKGFEETLRIMRGSAYCQGLPVEDWYHKSTNERPFDIVSPDDIIGVVERTDKRGDELAPLDPAEVTSAARQLVEAGCEAIAVCFLWSHVNPAHEEAASDLIRAEWPDLIVDTSSATIRILGEYERFSTTAVSSYVRPPLQRYVEALGAELRDAGLEHRLLVMQASGGLTPAAKATARAVSVLHSGPVGGVAAALTIAKLTGLDEVVTADMGGTSFDVSVISEGQVRYTNRSFQERHVVAAPMVDVASIGAGGGSIASVAAGKLRVGPESAGALPGPVCYGRGGDVPTVTDANLLLGYVNPDFFLGGKMSISLDDTRRAMEEKVAAPLGMSVEEAAWSVHRVVNSHMVDLTRFYLVQRGYDPRDFIMFVFGGATGLHACRIADELGAKAAMVPLAGLATVLSAFGIANSDVLRVVSAANAMPFPPEDAAGLESLYSGLEAEARADLAEDGFTPEEMASTRAALMRYHLQLTDVEVELPAAALDGPTADEIMKRFDDRYARLYGEEAGFREAGRDLMGESVRAWGRTPKGRIEMSEDGGADPSYARKSDRTCYFGELGLADTAIYDGDKLQPGALLRGPAVLEMAGTTVVVIPGYTARYDGYRNVWLEKDASAGEEAGHHAGA